MIFFKKKLAQKSAYFSLALCSLLSACGDGAPSKEDVHELIVQEGIRNDSYEIKESYHLNNSDEIRDFLNKKVDIEDVRCKHTKFIDQINNKKNYLCEITYKNDGKIHTGVSTFTNDGEYLVSDMDLYENFYGKNW